MIENLLVTGGSGFIGSNFIRYVMHKTDFSGILINVDKLTYAGNPDNLIDIETQFPSRYIFVQADIADKDAMVELFSRHTIEGICHFAAESHVDRSIAEPDDFIRTNIIGTYRLLQLARNHSKNLIRFHHVSTDEVYGSLGDSGYFSETTPYQPNSPYSASKASSDHLVRAYHHTYGLPITISNCSNNYGPYQFPEKLLPLMILNGLAGKSLPVYGNGQNVRDWLHVKDHCCAIWHIMQNGRNGETYNIGGANEMTNLELVEIVCDLLDGLAALPHIDSRRELITFVTDRPGHDWRYAIDFSKLRSELGWSPAIGFNDGVRATIQWYMENRDWVRRVESGEYRSWVKRHYGNL